MNNEYLHQSIYRSIWILFVTEGGFPKLQSVFVDLFSRFVISILYSMLSYFYQNLRMSSLDCAGHHHPLSQRGVLPVSDHHPRLWQTGDCGNIIDIDNVIRKGFSLDRLDMVMITNFDK